MYHNILLAYDGSIEGRRALREGASLALLCKAQVFLLAVIDSTAGLVTSDGSYAGVLDSEREEYETLLAEGVNRLRNMGFEPKSRLDWGQPAAQIVAVAEEIHADLVVVGHRHKGTLEQWWSGSVGVYLVKNLKCSLLVGHKDIDDSAFSALSAG